MDRLIIVGGGLAGGLAALAIRARHPDAPLTIVEPGTIGGVHRWSVFASDLDARGRALLDPLVEVRWPAYRVAFPDFSRTIANPYASLTGSALARAVAAAGIEVVRAAATALTGDTVTLDDGRVLEADAVLDCRGLDGPPPGLAVGWQKFVGQTLVSTTPHGVETPMVMNASVDQHDGYRFVYMLPLAPDRLFVEDTYYSDSSTLDRGQLASRIADQARAMGLGDVAVADEEVGVIPVVMGGDFDRFWPAGDAVARGGVRAGLFHPLTSYSLPDAVRFAHWLADRPVLDGLGAATRAYALAHWRAHRFERMLARMLFRAAAPGARWRVLSRFYRLPAPLIARFYAGRLTALDKLRILVGRPPVPVGAAIRAIAS